MTSPVEVTKGRAALPLSVVAEQDPFFIALGGPKAHDSSGRDDKGEGGWPGTAVSRMVTPEPPPFKTDCKFQTYAFLAIARSTISPII